MSRERELIKKNYSMDEEEETYDNLESIQGMMKEVKQEMPKEENTPRQTDSEGEINYQRYAPSSDSEEEKKQRKKKKLTKKRKQESEDYEEENLNDYKEEPLVESEEEDSEFDRKFTKKKRQRPKKTKTNKKKRGIRGGIDEFIQREAESESEEESEEDGGEITKEQQEKLLKEIYDRRDRQDVSQTSRKRLDLLEQTEEQIKQRYEGMEDELQNIELFEEGDLIGQQGRQPSISDPKLWLVKCRPGKEKECVENLFHKYFVYTKGDEKLKIFSVFCFDSLKGYIYVEAFKEANVREAIEGISALRENSIKIVPLPEMTQVFNYDKIQKVDLKPKQWVRIKTGLYEGDLAQVVHVEDPINKIYIRLIPRLSEQSNLDKKDNIGDYNRKLKKQVKPRQRLFNPKYYEDVMTKTHPILKEQIYSWNKMTFKDGFLVKSVRAKSLITEDVVPKIEELRIFDVAKIRFNEDEEIRMDFDSLISAIQETEINKKKKFVKGDKVKIIKGGLANITGRVMSHNNGIVQMMADIEGVDDLLELPENYIIKNFLPGDLVTVINGPHIGKSGLIVKVEDDTVAIFSESTMSEFKVSCHDIISSANYSHETEQNSYYQLGDLVKINGTNIVCYVLDVHKYSLKLIDTRSEIKNVSLKDVMKVTQHKPNGIDSKRNPITRDDTVKIIAGPYKGKKGVIKNVFKNSIFLYNQDFVSTNGIFVDKCENVEIMGSELLADVYNTAGGKVNIKRIPEEIRKLIGNFVKIIKGNWKGYIGTLKKVTDKCASVELSSKNKIITVDLSFIQRLEEENKNNLANISQSIMSTPRSHVGLKTPAYYPQTPSYNPTSPKWNPSATPNYWQAASPNPNRDIFMSPGSNYR